MMKDNEITRTNDKIEEYKKTKSLTLAERMNILKVNRDTCLLLDISISMGAADGGEKTRYESMTEVIAKFPVIRKFVFSSNCHEVLAGAEIPKPNGSTALDRGFNTVNEKGLKHIILLTDGGPNDTHAAINAAKAIKD